MNPLVIYRRRKIRQANPHQEMFEKPYDLARFLLIIKDHYRTPENSLLLAGFRCYGTAGGEFASGFVTYYWPKKLEEKAKKILKAARYTIYF